MANRRPTLLRLVTWTLLAVPTIALADPPEPVDFEQQIVPILVRSCLGCHNASDPKGQFDLSSYAALLKGGESGVAVVPGKADESYLFERIDEGSMPPEDKADPLSKQQVSLLRRWISQGAVWPRNRRLSPFELTTSQRAGRDWWSLQPVVRPQPPSIANQSWVRNPIDAFILAKLQQNKLQPAPEADRITFLRRAKFDLLGLPPTVAEIDAFLADRSAGAYRRLIDRLLDSPHYGERWGRHWLDVVRYTESDGFENDKFRPHSWRYRDYVINSFNSDKPYSQFILEQLAGDALPSATKSQRVATGFLVAGPWDEVQNVGASKIEMRRAHEEQIEELIGAVSQTFLGMTVNCARCHDHKFDPVSQTDYYSIKAVFDGVDHSRGRTLGNQSLFTPAEVKAQQEKIAPWQQRLKKQLAQLDQLNDSLPRELSTVRLVEPALTKGVFGSAIDARQTSVQAKSKPAYHRPPLTVECWAKAHSKSAFNIFVANNQKNAGAAHWELYSYRGKGDFSLFLPGYSPDEIRSGVDVTDGQWHYLAMQFDGKTVRLFVDGIQVKQQAVELVKAAGAIGEISVGSYLPQKIGCDGAIDELRISNTLRPISSLPKKAFQADAQTIGLWKFDQAAQGRFADHAFSNHAAGLKQLRAQRQALEISIKAARRQIADAVKEVPLAYIGFRRQPPPTYVLLRGDIKTPGQQVTPCGLSTIRFPSPQFGLTSETPEAQRRLRFAQWIASPDNPLPARVMANRIWQYHFGTGLVKTPSDFGFNGGLPSHSELLDWLADRFVARGWSIKQMHRLIMLSATYRQSSQYNAAAAKEDADNRLLWRFTPRRLEGEIIRDSMLAVSGQLNRQLGGPSYQPFTVTIFNTHFYHLFDSPQPQFNRRTIYRANVITGRDPLLDSLDCPIPAVAVPHRRSTVTPLQALSLMNDSFIVRQAEKFAQRVQKQAGNKIEAQTKLAFRMALSRQPTAGELAASGGLIQNHDLQSACWVLLNSSEFLYVR